MSFLNIKDKRKRAETIAEYLTLRERLKRRNLEERSDFVDHQRELEEQYEPVVKSSKEMAERVTDELKPIRKELANLNSLFARPKLVAKRKIKREYESNSDEEEPSDGEVVNDEEWEAPYEFGPLSEKFLNMYADDWSRRAKLDTTFGLRKDRDVWKIGNKRATIGPDDSIHVGDVKFYATPGFWSLATEKIPRNYTEDDLSRYKELLHETDAMYQDYDPLSHRPRSSGGHKWKMILSRIWREFKDDGIVQDLDESGYDADTSRIKEEGSGIMMYLRKDGKCYDLKKTMDGAMHISPRPKLTNVHVDGLYLRRPGSGIFCGNGLILGRNSPFKNIPILGWLL